MALRSLYVILIIGSLGLAGGAWWLLDQPISSVRIQGPLNEAEQAQLQRALSGVLNVGLLSLNLNDLKRQVAALSWPENIRIRRIWPDELVVQVVHQIPVARWGADSYLTSTGNLVQLPRIPRELPMLRTVQSDPENTLAVLQRLQAQADRADLSIKVLQENTLGEWQIELTTGVWVMLGKDQIEQRFERYLSVRSQFEHTVAYVDTRYAAGLAVRWQPFVASTE